MQSKGQGMERLFGLRDHYTAETEPNARHVKVLSRRRTNVVLKRAPHDAEAVLSRIHIRIDIWLLI